MRYFFDRKKYGLFSIAWTLLIGGAWYLVDCFMAYKTHPDVSWIKSGIYANYFGGFGWTVLLLIVGFSYGIYHLIRGFFHHDMEINS